MGPGRKRSVQPQHHVMVQGVERLRAIEQNEARGASPLADDVADRHVDSDGPGLSRGV